MGKQVLWVLLLGALLPAAVTASPRVVVSVPALHSLVAALTQGAGEPELLFGPGAELTMVMDPMQKAQLVAADMVIWAGPGSESGLGELLRRMPALASKSMALTDDIPLLTRASYQGPSEPRWQSRDPAFWTDPRLAMLVVHQITPQLVRLDPEHQELYLDNEMALMHRLHGLEAEIADQVAPLLSLPAGSLARVDPYFRHRFLDPAMAVAAADDGLRKVSGPGSATGTCTDPGLPGVAPGPAYYFEGMRLKAQVLASCLQGNDGAKTVATSAASAGASSY